MLIDTTQKLESIKPSLLACTNPCVDVESTGLSIFGNVERKRDVIIGIAIDDGTEAYYLPFRHLQGENLPLSCLEFFQKYLSDSHRTYIGWNYNYDMHMMAFDGIPIAENIEDVELAMHLFNENEPDFKLKPTADRYHIGDGSLQESILEDKVFEECQRLGLPCSRSSRSANNTKSMMYVLPPADVEPYACDDVRLTRQIRDLITPALKNAGIYDIWKQVNYYSYIICLMEHRGMHVDKDIIAKYQIEAVDKFKDAQKRLDDAAGFELNPNSSKKVCDFLHVQSSAAEVLIDVIDAGGQDAENAKLVQEARGWKSVDSRYYTPYLNAMDENGDLHCSLNLIGTYTGRLSCSNPNLQAVAKHTEVFKVKDVFTARKGYIMAQADYKQAEMRLVTHYTKDQLMKDLIVHDADLHAETANRLGIPRQAAKRLNFSVIYGVGAKSLSQSLRVDLSVAKDYLEKYHGLYPGFRRLMNQCEEFAKQNGYIEMWTGRLRHFNVPEADPHKAMSNLIQGGVAEIVRVAISRLYPAMKDIGANMLMQVHDSIIFEIPEENVNIALPTIQLIMEDFDFDPKPGVDIEYGYSWGLFQKWHGEIIDITQLPKP
jgi:DNA polymerase I-like protein with 3'-5' exonuclease and polymerase domains